MLPKRSGFEGLLRVGKLPDNGINGELIRFSLGNTTSTDQFINQLRFLYEKEGLGTISYDSTIHPTDEALVEAQAALNTG